MPDHINVPNLPAPTAPFSHMVRDEDYVFLSGIVAPDLEGGDAVVGDIGAETGLIMTAIEGLLASAGLETADVVRVEVHLVDLDDMDEMNAVYGSFFADGQAPARTTTQSAKLAGGGGVEITCMARVRRA